MTSIVHDLVGFVESGNTPPSLSQNNNTIGSRSLRVVAINLLGWLKSRAKFPNERPLTLRSDFEWCANLRTLMSSSPELSAMFQIDGDAFNFSSAVPQAQQREIEQFVNQNYRPPLFR